MGRKPKTYKCDICKDGTSGDNRQAWCEICFGLSHSVAMPELQGVNNALRKAMLDKHDVWVGLVDD